MLVRKLEALERRLVNMMAKDDNAKKRFEPAYKFAKQALDSANEGNHADALDAMSRFNTVMQEHRINKTSESEQDGMEKGERKIIRPPASKPNPHLRDEPAVDHGIKGNQVDFHTAKVRYAPSGTKENTRDHATYSEHVILHNNKPIGYATVHHQHPSDHGKVKGGGQYTTYHEHSVDIHAPGVHESAHGILRAKAKEYLKSHAFRDIVTKHNEKEHDYSRPDYGREGKKVKE